MCIYINTADTQKTDRQTDRSAGRQANKVITITFARLIKEVKITREIEGTSIRFHIPTTVASLGPGVNYFISFSRTNISLSRNNISLSK